MNKLHPDETPISVELVQALLATQFPQWTELPLTRVRSTGTDNVVYRLGDELAIRLPRIGWAAGQIDKESEWLPWFAPQLPLKLPVPLCKGEPMAGYPYQWGIYQWVAGERSTYEGLHDPMQTAISLADFLLTLRQTSTVDGPLAETENQRGLPLTVRDKVTRQAISDLAGMIDAKTATAVWECALEASQTDNCAVWFHGDLLSGNVLLEDGVVTAVIDFGGLAVGDPTCDLMIAWSLLQGESRDLFWERMGADQATWVRGRGHALSQAAMFIPYYLNTNPVGVHYARQMLDEVLHDFQING